VTYPKRLIEVDLPIARISAHARREKSIRHGHISTLHIWWARRPLAACRAVICAALWPNPGDPLCLVAFRDAAVRILTGFAKRVFPDRITAESQKLRETAKDSLGRWEALAAGTLMLDPRSKVDLPILRLCLLDFIADFANWDNSTAPAYLEAARRLTGVAHAALSDAEYRLSLDCGDLSPLSPAAEPLSSAATSGKKARRRTTADDPNKSGSAADQSGEESPHSKWLSTLDCQLSTLARPLVVDPFCGGGSIPLEALRVGADAFASDLNPVPVQLNKVVLEYIPKYGNVQIPMTNAQGEQIVFNGLAEAVRYWGNWIKERAEQELAEFYPQDPGGATPIAYLWAQTIKREGPGCGAEVPLIRSL
jgi:adenine-specific DNA methylase